MKIKQVFTTYDFCDNGGCKAIKYCPSCGSPFSYCNDHHRIRPQCLQCGFIYYKNPAPAVSVLIIENQHVLLGKRGPDSFAAGKWCLPCGYIEYNEAFLTAALREVKEETGLTIAIQSIINVNSNFLSENLHAIVVVLLAKVAAGIPAAGDDLVEVAWFDPAGPLPEMAFAADEDILKRYCAQKIAGLPIDDDFRR